MWVWLRVAWIFALFSMAVPAGAIAQGVDGVGRFETPDGAAFCSGALVAPDLVLTAAHCVAKYTGGNSPETYEFGFRPGRLRGSPVVRATRVVLHPLYRRAFNELQKLRFDLALVELTEPIPPSVSNALQDGDEARLGEDLFIVSWRGTDGATPRQKSCNVRRGYPGLVTLDCEVRSGESGSPVLRRSDGGLEVVAVISSRSEFLSRPTAQASNVLLRLPALMQELVRQRDRDGS